MFVLVRLSAFALAVATAQPLMAAEPAAMGAAAVAGPVMLVSGSANTAIKPPAKTIAPSLTYSLVRVVAVSTARLSAARQALQFLSAPGGPSLQNSSLLQEFPVVAAMRRRAGERWNTSDSSRPSDFALCYRLSRVMGFQVVPGDLTPGKLPTPRMVSVKNQGSGMGVLVGMTIRLGRAGR